MITTAPFDAIVTNNPFLDGVTIGYQVKSLFNTYFINYSPESLHFTGQSNSTCKYITIDSVFSETTIKLIREDNAIVVKEFTSNSDTVRIVTDSGKLAKIARKLARLNRIVQKQNQKYGAIRARVLKMTFNEAALKEFISLLPAQPAVDVSSFVARLKERQYTDRLPQIPGAHPNSIFASWFFNAFTDEMEEYNAIAVVDWRSLYSEVKDVLTNLFKASGINIELPTKPKKYSSKAYLDKVHDVLHITPYVMLTLGEISDTFVITLTEKNKVQNLIAAGKELGITVKLWESQSL